MALATAGNGTVVYAQMHHVDAPERVTRAVGVYEWTGELDKPTAARLIPLSLFLDGHLEDAGVYLARPVPFALGNGDVYSVERAGEPEGTLELDLARNLVTMRAPSADELTGSWYGYGRFVPPPAEAPAAKLKPSATLSKVVSSKDAGKTGAAKADDKDEDDDRPHMTRRPEAPTASPASAGDATPAPTPAEDDSERPTLRRRDASAAPDKKAKKHKESGSGVTGGGSSLNDDPDRPTMRRGGDPEETGTPQLTGMPAGLHQTAAVSDPATRGTHVFLRDWDSAAERADTLRTLSSLARPMMVDYLRKNGLRAGPGPPVQLIAASGGSAASTSGSAKPVGAGAATLNDDGGPPKLARGKPKTVSAAAPAGTSQSPAMAAAPTAHTASARRLAARKTAMAGAVVLGKEQLTGYLLSYGALPVFVYQAETPLADGGTAYLTLVAQRLPSGEMQVALTSLTDAAHLDRSPWMRLVDAVDPDAGHRASLLFELRAATGRQFALYRVTGPRAEQMFITGVLD